MSLLAGRLRHRVAIQARASVQDEDTGEMVPGWKTIAGLESVPCAIEPLSARDFIAAQAGQSQVTARIVMRYRALAQTVRFVHGDTIYTPAGMLPDAKSGREYVTIPVSSGVIEV